MSFLSPTPAPAGDRARCARSCQDHASSEPRNWPAARPSRRRRGQTAGVTGKTYGTPAQPDWRSAPRAPADHSHPIIELSARVWGKPIISV